MIFPTFKEERKLARQGYRLVAGIDEVGCGALAGPVCAAAVILPRRLKASWVELIKDSKQLLPAKRQELFHEIHESALTVGISMVSHEIIDDRGLTYAVRLAMKTAIDKLAPAPDSLLIDYVKLPDVPLPQCNIINGDELCFTVACASIIAKVTRDTYMTQQDELFPGYNFSQHKGYGTKEHYACLHKLGPSPIHRQSYQPIMDLFGEHEA